MPRSFYEWMDAKHQWYLNQQTRRADIPYPTHEVIIYQRQSDNPFWEARRLNAQENLADTFNLQFDQKDLTKFFRDAAIYERQKERDFISKFYPENDKSLSLTDKFNILFQSKDLYDKFNNRIKNILDVKQKQKNKSQKDNEYFTGRAPNLSSFFATYFEKHFNEEIQKFYVDIDKKGKDLEAEFENVIRRAAVAASEEMANILPENDNGYGSGEEWRAVYEALQGGGRAQDLFIENLKNAIGLENLQTLRNMLVSRKNNGNKRIGKNQIKELIQSQLKGIGSRQASIGGSILESVISIIANSINSGKGKNGLEYQMLAENFGGSKVVTDAVMLFSTNMEIDLQKVMDNMRADLYSTEGKQTQLYNGLEKFYNRYNEDLNDMYQVFINAKNYAIGANGRDYTKNQSGDLEELPSFLESTGVHVNNVIKFMDFICNTAIGAIYESDREEVMENITNALKAAASKLMFDDYQSIGVSEDNLFGNRNSIHMYYLSGKYIPSSEVFKSMADALDDAVVNTKADITLPGEIEDEGPEWSNLHQNGETDADFKERLWIQWGEEYKRLKAAVNWHVSFTLRIKTILSSIK